MEPAKLRAWLVTVYYTKTRIYIDQESLTQVHSMFEIYQFHSSIYPYKLIYILYKIQMLISLSGLPPLLRGCSGSDVVIKSVSYVSFWLMLTDCSVTSRGCSVIIRNHPVTIPCRLRQQPQKPQRFWVFISRPHNFAVRFWVSILRPNPTPCRSLGAHKVYALAGDAMGSQYD